MLLVPMISDSKGRRLPLLASLIVSIMACCSITIGVYTSNFFLMFFGQMFLGFVASGMVVLGYVYVSEFCSDSHRQKGLIAIMISWYLYDYLGLLGILFL